MDGANRENQRYNCAQKITNLIDSNKLCKLQQRVAEFLEGACISLSNHVDLSTKELVLSSNAQEFHIKTNKLLTEFGDTLDHVLEIMMPLVLHGIKVENIELLINACDDVIENADEMKKETHITTEMYSKLQDEMTNLLKATEHKNRKEQDNYEVVQTKRRIAEEELNRAKLEQRDLQKKKKELELSLKRLKEPSDSLNADAGRSKDRNTQTVSSEDVDSWTRFSLRGVHSLFTKYISGSRLETRATTNSYIQQTDLEAQISQLRQDIQTARSCLHRKNKDVIDKTSEVEKLQAVKVKPVESKELKQAYDELGRFLEPFSHFEIFWESMKIEVRCLKTAFSCGEEWQIQKMRDRFKDYDAECRVLVKMFRDHIHVSEMEVHTLYNFICESQPECEVTHNRKAIEPGQ